MRGMLCHAACLVKQGKPDVWPNPSHSPPKRASVFFPGIKLPVPGKSAAKAGAFYLRAGRSYDGMKRQFRQWPFPGTNRFPANEAGRMIT